jgi:predicted membrane protein
MLNWLTGYNVSSVATIFNIILVPVAFFVHGIPTLILFDYPFFTGALTILQWILRATFGMGTVYALFQDSRGWSMGWLSKF